jgi:hypothetical protein
MSTCLSHLWLWAERSILSGTDEPGIELSDQLEQLWLEAEDEAKETRTEEEHGTEQ